jgi:hypothetical protein
MFPAVAHVVEVVEALDAAGDERIETLALGKNIAGAMELVGGRRPTPSPPGLRRAVV